MFKLIKKKINGQFNLSTVCSFYYHNIATNFCFRFTNPCRTLKGTKLYELNADIS